MRYSVRKKLFRLPFFMGEKHACRRGLEKLFFFLRSTRQTLSWEVRVSSPSLFLLQFPNSSFFSCNVLKDRINLASFSEDLVNTTTREDEQKCESVSGHPFILPTLALSLLFGPDSEEKEGKKKTCFMKLVKQQVISVPTIAQAGNDQMLLSIKEKKGHSFGGAL